VTPPASPYGNGGNGGTASAPPPIAVGESAAAPQGSNGGGVAGSADVPIAETGGTGNGSTTKPAKAAKDKTAPKTKKTDDAASAGEANGSGNGKSGNGKKAKGKSEPGEKWGWGAE